MKVGALIEKLKEFDPELDACFVWDGAVRSEVCVVWKTRGNAHHDPVLAMSPFGETVYHDHDRPEGAPTQKESRHWSTEADPNPEEW